MKIREIPDGNAIEIEGELNLEMWVTAIQKIEERRDEVTSVAISANDAAKLIESSPLLRENLTQTKDGIFLLHRRLDFSIPIRGEAYLHGERSKFSVCLVYPTTKGRRLTTNGFRKRFGLSDKCI